MATASETTLHHAVELLGRVTPAIVSLSFALGLSIVIGTCLAIGNDSFGFLTISDILVSALLGAPALSAQFSIMTMLRLLREEAATAGSDDDVMRLPRVLLYGAVAMLFGGWLLLDERSFSTIPLFVVILGGAYFTENIRYSVRSGHVTKMAQLFAATCLMLLVLTAMAFSMTSIKATLPSDGKVRATHELCMDDCREAKLISRFSEVTVVRWASDARVAYVRNDEIRSVSKLDSANREALVDLRVLWRWILAWF